MSEYTAEKLSAYEWRYLLQYHARTGEPLKLTIGKQEFVVRAEKAE